MPHGPDIYKCDLLYVLLLVRKFEYDYVVSYFLWEVDIQQSRNDAEHIFIL